MEGDNVAVNKKRGKDKGKRKSSQWSDERRIAQKKVEDRRAEENKARLNELTPGSVAYLFEMRKQREREKAAEKKRNYRSRRQSIAPSYSPTQQFLTLSDGSVLLNPMRTPLVTGSIAYTYTPISSSSSSTSTAVTAAPSSSTPRLAVEMEATPSASGSSSLGNALATSSDSSDSTTTSTTAATATRKKSKNRKATKTLTELLANVANRRLNDYGKSSQTFYRKIIEEGTLQVAT